jgi:hypothetical protein
MVWYGTCSGGEQGDSRGAICLQPSNGFFEGSNVVVDVLIHLDTLELTTAHAHLHRYVHPSCEIRRHEQTNRTDAEDTCTRVSKSVSGRIDGMEVGHKRSVLTVKMSIKLVGGG